MTKAHAMNFRPTPIANAETSPFWDGAAKGELRLPRCEACGALYYPPPPRCPTCLTDKLAWTRLSGRGRIFAWTTVYLETVPGVAPPFTLLEVELEEQPGLILAALLETPRTEPVEVGCAVEMTFTPQNAVKVSYPQFRLVNKKDGGPSSGLIGDGV
jgi:uncharacterized protein